MLGTRYKSYCSNIVRTLLVEPTADMQANYDLLLHVEEEILNKLQHGTELQNSIDDGSVSTVRVNFKAQPLKLRLALTLTLTDTGGAVLTLRTIEPSNYRAAT